MRTQFASQLNLKQNRTTVAAAGEFRWDEIPSSVNAVKVVATISQQNGGAAVCGNATSRSYSRGEGTWTCDVTADNGAAYADGQASATGVLVNSEDPGTDPWSWTGSPQLGS